VCFVAVTNQQYTKADLDRDYEEKVEQKKIIQDDQAIKSLLNDKRYE